MVITLEMVKKMLFISDEKFEEFQKIANKFFLKKSPELGCDYYVKNQNFLFPIFSDQKEGVIFLFILIEIWGYNKKIFKEKNTVFDRWFHGDFWVLSETDIRLVYGEDPPSDIKPEIPPKLNILERILGREWYKLPFVSYGVYSRTQSDTRYYATRVDLNFLLEFLVLF
jgi:hypothetical protein